MQKSRHWCQVTNYEISSLMTPYSPVNFLHWAVLVIKAFDSGIFCNSSKSCIHSTKSQDKLSTANTVEYFTMLLLPLIYFMFLVSIRVARILKYALQGALCIATYM